MDRDGFVMSEGSTILVLESLDHAQARGARIYAEVIGYGNSADAYHMAAPHSEGRGAVDAMRMALTKAAAYGVQPEDVDYINAHGTATQLNDIGETKAIKEIFGDHAYRLTHQQHQEHDRPSAGGRGGAGGPGLRQGGGERHDPAHHQPAQPGPGVRPGLHPPGRPPVRRQRDPEQQLRLWRA